MPSCTLTPSTTLTPSPLLVPCTGTPTTTAQPGFNWPAMGFDVDFTQGPPQTPGPKRVSINAPYRQTTVRQFTIHRGRQFELDQVQAGTLDLTMVDLLENLCPDNTSSPFNTGGNTVTSYRCCQVWAMWPTAPGSGNIINNGVDPNYDPSFESNPHGLLGLWTSPSGSTTLARSSVQALDGAFSLLVTQATAGAGFGATNTFRTSPEYAYTFSVSVYPTGGTSVTIQVVDALGTVHTSSTATTQNAWTQLSVTWTAVDTLEPITIYGTVATTPTFYIDNTQLEFGSTVNTFTTSGPFLYPLYTGYVERFPSTYDMAGARGLRPLTAVDALAVLSRIAIDQSYKAEVTADTPFVSLPLDNTAAPATSTQFGIGLGAGAYPNYIISANGSINWGGDKHLDGTPAVVFTAQNPTTPPTFFPNNSYTEMAIQGCQVSLDSNQGFTWECWVRWTSGTVQIGTIELLAPGAPRGLNQGVPLIGAFSLGSTTLGPIYNNANNNTNFQYFFLPLFADGEWHYMNQTILGSAWNFRVDDGTATGASVAATVLPLGQVGFNTFYMEASTQFAEPQSQVASGRFAVYRGVLSQQRILAHYYRGVGYINEISGARVTRLLNQYWTGVTKVATGTVALAPDFTYDPLPTTSGAASTQARVMLDVLQEIQETERGLIYVDRSGVVVFEDRSSRYSNQTGLWVFGENPTGASPPEYPYTDIKYDYDPTYTFSQANLSRPGNNNFPPVTNAIAKQTYGLRILTQTAQVTNDFDLTEAANFYLQRYNKPTTRVASLVLKPSANPQLWPVVLSLELSQRVTVKRRTAFTKTNDYYIEQIDHRVDPETGDWTTTLQLSPVFVTSAWVLGDVTYGILGTTTTPIY